MQSRTSWNGNPICEPVFISDPIIPRYFQWVGLLKIDALAWAPRRELMDVLSRNAPVAISQFRSTPSTTFTVMTRTLQERAQFVEIMNTGRILLIRNPDPSYPENMWYVSIGNVSEERILPDHRSPLRRWVLDVQVVDRPSGLITALTGQSWQVVRVTYPEWIDVQNNNEAWINVLLGTSTVGGINVAGVLSGAVAVPSMPTVEAAQTSAWEPVN